MQVILREYPKPQGGNTGWDEGAKDDGGPLSPEGLSVQEFKRSGSPEAGTVVDAGLLQQENTECVHARRESGSGEQARGSQVAGGGAPTARGRGTIPSIPASTKGRVAGGAHRPG